MNKSKRRKSRQNENEEVTFLSVILQSVFFIPFFVLISAIFILIFSAMFYRFSDPTSKISLAGIIALCISVALSSFIYCVKNKGKFLLRGLVFGLMSIIIILLVSIFASKNPPCAQNYLFSLLVMFCSVIGSFFASKLLNRRKPHRRH